MSDGSPKKPIGVLPSTLFFLSGSLSKAADDILVLMNPGAIQLTRIPDGASSVAIARVIDSMAPLLAEYAITFGIPYCEAIELMLIILPPPFSFMFLITSRLTVKTLKRLV